MGRQQTAGVGQSLSHYADAICIPLIRDGQMLGAIHIYLERGRFDQADFDFAISLANIMVVALVRARHQATLQVDHQRLAEKSADCDEFTSVSEAPRRALTVFPGATFTLALTGMMRRCGSRVRCKATGR